MTSTISNCLSGVPVLTPGIVPTGFSKELTFSELACLRLCGLLKQWSGVNVESSKAYLIQGRLRSLMVNEKISDLNVLLDRAVSASGTSLRNSIVDLMTTHETLFFRDRHPFETLTERLLPPLLSDATRAARPIEIHCAACSSGQEPYSVAMTLKERFNAAQIARVRISASDVSQGTIEAARRGEFMDHELRRGLSVEQQRRYLEPATNLSPTSDARLIESIRSMVRFQTMNLTTRLPLAADSIDILFCRNVLIYFDAPTKQQVLRNLAAVIRRGGVLLLGSSEMLRDTENLFRSETLGTTVLHRRV